MPVHHVKGQPAASTYVQEKGGVTCDTNRGTHCMKEKKTPKCGMFMAVIDRYGHFSFRPLPLQIYR